MDSYTLRTSPRMVSPSSSSSSSSSSAGYPPPSGDVTSSYRSRPIHSRESSEIIDDPSPTRDSVSAALDRYMMASRVGREAFITGDLLGAMKEFDQALDIELQTEMECLYDTSIGFVSGLVRSEVDAKLDEQGRHGNYSSTTKCTKILQQLQDLYSEAAERVKSRRNNSQWYLQMGAALVVINEWDKAKAVYSEGINLCKDRKELKTALKNLIKIEQMTSYADIPLEDQPNHNHVGSKPSPYNSPCHSLAQKQVSNQTLPSSVQTQSYSSQLQENKARDRSKSLSAFKRKISRSRTNSLSLESSESKESDPEKRLSYSAGTPPISKKVKRRSANLFGKNPSLLSPEETMMWGTCFEPESCRVVSANEFQPSAITHMRRLTSVGGTDEETGDYSLNSSFNAVNFTSMRIEDDDSELDDSD